MIFSSRKSKLNRRSGPIQPSVTPATVTAVSGKSSKLVSSFTRGTASTPASDTDSPQAAGQTLRPGLNFTTLPGSESQVPRSPLWKVVDFDSESAREAGGSLPQ